MRCRPASGTCRPRRWQRRRFSSSTGVGIAGSSADAADGLPAVAQLGRAAARAGLGMLDAPAGTGGRGYELLADAQSGIAGHRRVRTTADCAPCRSATHRQRGSELRTAVPGVCRHHGAAKRRPQCLGLSPLHATTRALGFGCRLTATRLLTRSAVSVRQVDKRKVANYKNFIAV